VKTGNSLQKDRSANVNGNQSNRRKETISLFFFWVKKEDKSFIFPESLAMNAKFYLTLLR